MKLSRVAGRGLLEMAKGLRGLSNGSHQTELQKTLGKEAIELVRDGIESGRSPDGDAWPKRAADGALALQPLAAHVEYRPLPPNPFECAVEVRVNHWTANFAQRGTLQHGVVHNPERPLVPDGQPPPGWIARIRASAGVAFSAAVRRAVKGE
ncbi:hypothetical protein [Polyangium sp. 15x6]|uniref:hypothetical protein n=1 Tax=Polyangium sp. 15x6 TaxID=3042687 RepID=UPI00249C66D2|nr:hypothetical protein [Polyangium sp. 15x6]MDI3291832.1 hypothetical protein [Polyangium sp. 15x6]